MIVESALIWEGAKAAGIVFWPVLKSLAEDSAKDYGKDFFKDCLKNVFRLPEKDVQKEAYLTALEAFLQIFQKELENADYQEGQINQYLKPIQKFIEQPKVSAILGNAFEVNCKSLDIPFLDQTWQEMNLPFLPEDFDWELIGKLYVRSVKQIITKSEKLRPIYDIQLQEKNAENLQALVGIAPDYNLEKYAEGLREQFGNLRLDSLASDGPSYNNLRLWKIFIPQNVRECQEFLPQVYEVPKDHIKRLREAGEDIEILSEEELERQRHRYINQQSQLVWEVIGDPTAKPAKSPIQQVVILGDPGAGKSSLLQYIALIWAERPLRDLSLYPIPLLLELRIYARDKQAGKCQDILSFIDKGNITCRLNQQELHEKLRSGQAVALFDGIDEIFDPVLREEVVTDIHRFSNDYAQVQVIITSRWLGYKAQRLRDAGFRHFMLQDLEIEQIEDFLERWHELFTDQLDNLRKKERLIKAIQDSKSIRELAGNPLLLTMMAILNRHQELPRNRSDLYNKASEVLLHQWDMEVKLLENPKLKDWKIEIALIDKQKMLRKVAYFMQSNKKDTSGNLISKSDLENILTESLREIIERGEPRMIARVMSEELRTRNFILCFLGADSYGFVHRTFLEYFCAWEFVWQFKETQTLTIDQLINDVFEAHWQDESWHEVLRLICGMIDPKFVAEIIDFLLEQKIDKKQFFYQGDDYFPWLDYKGLNNLILSAYCLLETKNRLHMSETSKKILAELKNQVENPDYLLHGKTLEILVLLIINIGEDKYEILKWTQSCLKTNLINKNKTSNMISEFKELSKKTDLEIAEMELCDKIDDYLNERDSVIFPVINQYYKYTQDINIIDFLKKNALNHESIDVRCQILSIVSKDWKNLPDIPQFIRECALNDKNKNVREKAVSIIVEDWKGNLDIYSFLICAAKQNSISSETILTILEEWREGSQLLEFLYNCIIFDTSKCIYLFSDANPRNQLIKEKSNILLLPPPRRYYHDARSIALEALLEKFSNHPKTIETLSYLVVNDSDAKLRKFAVEKLQDLKKPNP